MSRAAHFARLAVIAPIAILASLHSSPARAQYAEQTPGLKLTLGPVDFSMHGYFRAPLRLSWRDRGDSLKEGELLYSVRTPWLVDDDYFRSGFAYTRLQEQDWTELFLSVGNKHITGTVGLMGSLYSGWARPLLERQWGISQGYLTFKWDWEREKWRFHLQAKAGAFWDRFGWLEMYDTYMFGRIHQMGAQVRGQLDLGRLSLALVWGFGAHLEAIELNQGLTLLNYVSATASFGGIAGIGAYFLDGATQDKRQLKEITDAYERVGGVDMWVKHPLVGRLYLAVSQVTADQATYLSPAIEVLHSWGGRGLTENYFGTEKSDNGTGSITSVAVDWLWSTRFLLDRYAAPAGSKLGENGDVTLRLFCLYSKVQSNQADPDPTINRDGRGYFKWGGEVAWRALPWLAASLRYDRVILDLDDDASAFRMLTPRLTFMTKWWVNGQIFLQYSKYWYGARVALRPGQVALETAPDADVFKIQAQFVF